MKLKAVFGLLSLALFGSIIYAAISTNQVFEVFVSGVLCTTLLSIVASTMHANEYSYSTSVPALVVVCALNTTVVSTLALAVVFVFTTL